MQESFVLDLGQLTLFNVPSKSFIWLLELHLDHGQINPGDIRGYHLFMDQVGDPLWRNRVRQDQILSSDFRGGVHA